MADETVLSISGPGIAPWSARGLTQTLQPIAAAGQLRRSVNGTLVDLSPSVMRKYRSVITGRDVLAPALDGIWPGQQLTVDCVAELAYLTSGGSPERSVVAGSSRVEGNYTYYRPQLTMRVVGFDQSEDEWGQEVTWQLELEEV